jgi:AcrR family transcriptional regulator
MADEPRTRRPKSATKAAILDAAKRRVIEDGLPELLTVRLTDVLEELQLTTGAAYQIWASQQEFQKELLREVVSDFAFAGPQSLPNGGDLAADMSQEERIRKLGQAYFDYFTARSEFFVALQAWTVKDPSDQLTQSVRTGYSIVHNQFAQFFQFSLQRYGRRIREPFSIDDAMTLVTACTEGLALRHRFEPDAVITAGGTHLFSEALLAILERFTEPIEGDGPTPEARDGDPS